MAGKNSTKEDVNNRFSDVIARMEEETKKVEKIKKEQKKKDALESDKVLDKDGKSKKTKALKNKTDVGSAIKADKKAETKNNENKKTEPKKKEIKKTEPKKKEIKKTEPKKKEIKKTEVKKIEDKKTEAKIELVKNDRLSNKKTGSKHMKELRSKRQHKPTPGLPNGIEQNELGIIKKEIKEETGFSKDRKRILYSKIFRNLMLAIIVIAYFIILNIGYITIVPDTFFKSLKIVSIVSMFLTICIFEYAYKKDNGKFALNGIECLSISVITLLSMHIYNIYNEYFMLAMTTCSMIFMFYYIVKSIIAGVKEKKVMKMEIIDRY